MKKRRLVISGWFGSGNIGDEAIIKCMLTSITDKIKNIEIVVLTPFPDNVKAYYRVNAIKHNAFLSGRGLFNLICKGGVNKLLSNIARADVFILGGGGLLKDSGGLKNLLYTIDECVLAKLFDVPVMYFAIGIGPFSTKIGKSFLKKISMSVDLITIRDRNSQQLLESFCTKKNEVQKNKTILTTADPAFLLPTIPPHNHELLTKMRQGKNWVAICPRGFRNLKKVGRKKFLLDQFLTEIGSVCDYLVEYSNANIIFVPFCKNPSDNDQEFIHQIINVMNSNNVAKTTILHNHYSPEEIKWIISQTRYVVGMRLHSLIFAASEGVPFIGLYRRPKIKDLLDELECLDLGLELENFNRETCVNKLGYLRDSYHEIKARVETAARKMKQKANYNFILLDNLLKRQ